ncbi:hypodermin-A-like [Drosophila kikkawai]|uniref:trypsin n=1 Tax=Drosophila kikkawai TaxID=30033 RepID=A0ABM4GKC8_DROKI
MLEKYFIVLCTAALLSAEGIPEQQERIIGGDYVPIEDVPWQVALLRNEKHFCGGSIYNQRVILTAAHCVKGKKLRGLSVRAGSALKNFGGQLVSVDRVILHQDYVSSTDTLENDIAVLFLASPLELGPTVQPIKLAEESPEPGTNVLVTGWGALHDRPFLFFKEILLRTILTIVDRNECFEAYIADNFAIPIQEAQWLLCTPKDLLASFLVCIHVLGNSPSSILTSQR